MGNISRLIASTMASVPELSGNEPASLLINLGHLGCSSSMRKSCANIRA